MEFHKENCNIDYDTFVVASRHKTDTKSTVLRFYSDPKIQRERSIKTDIFLLIALGGKMCEARWLKVDWQLLSWDSTRCKNCSNTRTQRRSQVRAQLARMHIHTNTHEHRLWANTIGTVHPACICNLWMASDRPATFVVVGLCGSDAAVLSSVTAHHALDYQCDVFCLRRGLDDTMLPFRVCVRIKTIVWVWCGGVCCFYYVAKHATHVFVMVGCCVARFKIGDIFKFIGNMQLGLGGGDWAAGLWVVAWTDRTQCARRVIKWII